MARSKIQAKSIYEVTKHKSPDKALPVYFMFGDDQYAVGEATGELRKAFQPLAESDFDFEIVNGEKGMSASQVVDLASAFPFGSGKKVIIVKNFERLNDKKVLAEYVNNPADFTILIITQEGKAGVGEPFASLNKNGYLFEAKNPRGDDWVNWLMMQIEKEGLKITRENARALVDIVGENKGLLQMQLKKFADFVDDDKEITLRVIQELASSTKEFNIFNLQDALGKGDKPQAIGIALNMVNAGQEPVYIIAMLAKFVTALSHITELAKKRMQDRDAAKAAGLSYYYYINCKKAAYLLSLKRLAKASRALMDAEVRVKSTSTDNKSLITMLISEMLD